MADNIIQQQQLSAIQRRYIVLVIDYLLPNEKTPKQLVIKGYSGANSDGSDYLAVNVEITKVFGIMGDTANIVIKGLTSSEINTLTIANLSLLNLYPEANVITVYAGYTLGNNGYPPLVYRGFIMFATPDYNQSRDRPFIIQSEQLFATQNKLVPSLNVQGTISVNDLLKKIITSHVNDKGQSYIFSDNQIPIIGSTSNPIYKTDSLKSQLDQVCYDYNLRYHLESDGVTITVIPVTYPYSSDKSGTSLYTISYKTGMIGYPTLETGALNVKTYFNPIYRIGDRVAVNSITMPYVNNMKLYINALSYSLSNKESQFFTQLQLGTISVTI